jgi:hypothetical protein
VIFNKQIVKRERGFLFTSKWKGKGVFSR